ncbi:hypothetical protein R3G94_004787 [Escherichia coli]|uniref:Uncharacterized protein n=2 Tax=Enterobacteriaceae TaxID=543 RepID=A0A8H8ZCE2_SHIFL|nr:Mobile element protein [Shigella sonnei]EEZ5526164.1 hypothetical protein [Escherichia coli]EFP8788645.1 hypothetical protein [Shigella flexneri]EIQ36919.1 putative transposase [Shigella sonnei 3226-85]EIQ40182.1 putative transposase [Shigella sonnei 3233-85]EIQ50498.1 putative transposase [Shigella sonnei 4822-66]ELF39736.1 hypothetical protein A31Q_01500 [Escherichia coli KTE171]EZJ09981.1 putative transposase [Escherichia coli 1-182-04_S4_C3]EZJ47904.1 putative transposase [Escherichi
MPLLDKLRGQYGVGPVCSELHIAPSTYYHCQQQDIILINAVPVRSTMTG